MNTKTTRGHRRLCRIASIGGLATAFLAATGCAYVETVARRAAQNPDDRIVLSARDGILQIQPPDLTHYVCAPPFMLQCERPAVTYSCQCALR